jgi:4-amino-4-deoxy-L-arabinose transferase-like glycosyltransferase
MTQAFVSKPALPGRAGWALTVAILIAASIVGVAGIAKLPLDSHEAFVAQTAQEMHDRADWLVPYFNQQPRLTKPPLAYWLTALTATAGSRQPWRVEPWHARLPSVFAGVAAVGFTIWIGRELFDRETGLAAGLLMVTSVGYFNYTHSARPEMLYAAWCTAAIACFARSWSLAATATPGIPYTYGMWLAFALATLTKGPHVPAILIAGFLVFLLTQRTAAKTILHVLRPTTGLLLCLAVALPWWWWVYRAVPREALGESELTGSALRIGWSNLLDPGFIYRAPTLILPWAVFIPAAVALPWRSPPQRRDRARLLAWTVAVMIVLMSLGSRRHAYYLLPILGPMAVLLGAGAADLFRKLAKTGSPASKRFWGWILALHGVGGLGIIVWLWGLAGTSQHPPLAVMLALFLLALAVLAATGVRVWWQTPQPVFHWINSASVIVLVFVGVGYAGQARSSRRYLHADLAQAVTRLVPPEVPLAAWEADASVFVYYAQRPVIECRSPQQIRTALERTPTHRLALLSPPNRLDELQNQFNVTVLREVIGNEQTEHSLQLLELAPLVPSQAQDTPP